MRPETIEVTVSLKLTCDPDRPHNKLHLTQVGEYAPA